MISIDNYNLIISYVKSPRLRIHMTNYPLSMTDSQWMSLIRKVVEGDDYIKLMTYYKHHADKHELRKLASITIKAYKQSKQVTKYCDKMLKYHHIKPGMPVYPLHSVCHLPCVFSMGDVIYDANDEQQVPYIIIDTPHHSSTVNSIEDEVYSCLPVDVDNVKQSLYHGSRRTIHVLDAVYSETKTKYQSKKIATYRRLLKVK